MPISAAAVAVATPCCPGSRFGDETGLAHLLGQQRLAKDIIDLMRAGVVQVFPLEIDLRTAQVLGHFFGVVES